METARVTEPAGPPIDDLDSFVDQFRQHGPAVHAYLSRRVGANEADDLFSEVWMRAFRSRHTYDRRHPDPRPWLYGIARHTLSRHWQRGRTPDALADRRGSVDPTDPWTAADARLDAAAQRPSLRDALAQLGEEEREVLLLVAWEGLTPAEVALTLGIPQGTARSRLHRARHAVQIALNSGNVIPLSPLPKEASP